MDLLLVDLNKPAGRATRDREVDEKAKTWAAEKGYDPVFGARPLKRFLQRNIETKLARALLSGEVQEGSDLTFTIRGEELGFERRPLVAG